MITLTCSIWVCKKKNSSTLSSIFFVKIAITRIFHLSNGYYIHIFRLVAKCRVVILFDVIYASISSICFTKFFPSMVTKKEKEGGKEKNSFFHFSSFVILSKIVTYLLASNILLWCFLSDVNIFITKAC